MGSSSPKAVADAVNNAGSLCSLIIGLGSATFPGDPSGLAALASAVRAHKALQEFTWYDFLHRYEASPQDLSLDTVLQALIAGPHLRKVTIPTSCASAGAIKALVQLQSVAHLSLGVNRERYLAVAEGIRQGHCNIKHLDLKIPQSSISEATEAVKAIASVIRLDFNLESLYLQIVNRDCTDEAGIVLAEALTLNKTLRKITLGSRPRLRARSADALSTSDYEAFCAMLRVNTSLVLKVPPFDDDVGDERLVDSHHQRLIELRLNEVGRGRLLS